MSSLSEERVLEGGGAMGALMRATDWARTPLGPLSRWPQSLRTSVSIMLDSRFAMVIAWGPEFIFLYNDRYRPVLGATKHPVALGRPARESFPEVWDFIGPLFEQTRRGEAVALDDVLIPLDRNGYLEECFFTLSYSPIRDESGGVGGMLAVVTETTGRVQGERRLRTLRDLAAIAADAKTSPQACENAALMLSSNGADVPFAVFYTIEDDGVARRVAMTGLLDGSPAAPRCLSLASSSAAAWPLTDVLADGGPRVVPDLGERFGPLPGGAYPESTHTAIVLPLARPGQPRPYGFMMAGISPRHALDDEYRTFLSLAAEHVVTAIANARAYEEERRRAEALAELDRAKTTFFSNVSHELRTPLTLILGPLEDVLRGRHGDMSPSAAEELTVAQRGATRLLKLVNTLLDFARIEAGRVQASYEPTAIGALTAELASVFRSAVERGGLRLVVDCEEPTAPVVVDREMWEKIVLNLISNAFKFTFEGEIGVRLRQVGPEVHFEVSDTGIGISAEDLPRVFERFRRIEGARSRTHEGSGIGLALVQELVRMHGGRIEVESTPGRGTRFRAVIPTGDAHLPRERVTAPRAAALPTTIRPEAFAQEALQWLPQTFESAGGPAPSGGRVLVVDDNRDMRDYLRRLLEAHWSVDAAEDGASALAAIELEPPDLVLTDIMMPAMDGYELLRRLRQDPATRTLPVILLSARAGEEATVDGMSAGADDYLVKPFTPAELIARVGSHLRIAQYRERINAESVSLHAHAERREAELQALIDSSQALIFAKDLHGHYITVNRPFADYAQKAREQILGCTDEQIFAPEVAPVFRDGDEDVLESGRTVQLERSFPFPNGVRLFVTTKSPLRDAHGQTYGVCGIATDVTEQQRMQQRLLEESRVRETLHRLAASFATELDEQKLLQLITDEATSLTGASFGAFFFNRTDQRGDVYMLYTLSGAPAAAFSRFRPPRATPLFAPTFRGEGTIRLDDVRKDPRFGQWGPQPEGHLPVVSYLAVPVTTRAGEVLGGLFFGHRDAGQFTADHAELVEGIASHAAVALENARLYGALEKSRTAADAAWRLAAEADRRKDEFLAVLGHELRNPLAPITTALQLIRLRGHDTDRELSVIERQVQHLSRLVDDLLDISRITRGRLQLDRERVDLSVVVARAIEMASPLVEQRRHTLNVDVPASGLSVHADVVRLSQVVSNLLTNAARYTPPGGRIDLTARRDGDKAVITVRDNGSGIAPEMLGRIFDPFVQAPQAIDRASGGLGIGLTLVRSLVELHGGTVSAHSAGPGAGAEFEVRLPAAAAPESSAALAPLPLPDTTTPRRVVVVDDNQDSADMLGLMLTAVGHQVEVVYDPAGALALDGPPPEVVLLDIGLPVMDGYELGRRLRERYGRSVRLIALTGYGQEDDRARSEQAGFDGHLVKPVNAAELLQLLER